MRDQLGLFGEATLDKQYDKLRPLASSLPPNLYLGTSSWAFPGWRGIVYARKQTPTELSREGLREYSRHPLLRTVEIDRSYYAPVPQEDLERYAAQIAPHFRVCVKAPAIVTSASLPARTPRPEPNPDFLSAERLKLDLLDPLANTLAPNLGPLILQFPPQPSSFRLTPKVFADRLDAFFADLSRHGGGTDRGFRFAVELRDPLLLTPDYARALSKHGATHAFNFWSSMPMPAVQADLIRPEDFAHIVIRLMLPPGTTYDGRRENFRPFDRIHEPHEEMRRQVVGLIRRAAREKKETYVIINNKAEGSAPLTIRALAEMLAASRS